MRGGRSSLESLGLGVGETVDFTVRGHCMQILADGESVQVRRQRFYVPGDVVVVRRRGHWNAHRFLGYAPSAHGVVALTQADRSGLDDSAAPVRAIVGRATCTTTARDRGAALRRYASALFRRVTKVAR